MNLRDIVQRDDSLAGRAFDWAMIGLIVVSVVILSVETLPDLPETVHRALRNAELVILGLFAVEYVLRVATSPNRSAYAFSFFGIIDLLAIVPLGLALFLPAENLADLQALRMLRLFRLLSMLKLVRYGGAVVRFGRAIGIAREELLLFLGFALVVLYLAACGIYYFEHEAQPEAFSSIFHSLWWATATLTTVGYGDVYPITVGGRMFTFVVLMCGLGIVAVPAGLVASALSVVRQDEAAKRNDAASDTPPAGAEGMPSPLPDSAAE